MGASVGIGGLIVGTSMMVVFALAITTIDLRMESSLETLDSANDPLPSFVIENADFWEGAIIDVNIVDPGAGYVDGTLSTSDAGGFAASFTVDSVTGEIVSVTVTSHGNYSSTPPLPSIQVDGPQPGVTSPADLEAVMGSIIHTNVTNTGSVTLPYNEVWFFLDGGERLQSMEFILGGPGVSTNWYSGETTYLQWQFNTPSNFESMAVSADGYNIARSLD